MDPLFAAGMRAVLAAVGLVALVGLTFGDVFRGMFTPPAVTMAHPQALSPVAYPGAYAPYQTITYAEPAVYTQTETVDGGRSGFSDVALLALVGAAVGAAVAHASSGGSSPEVNAAVAEPDVESATAATRIAALAVGGQGLAPAGRAGEGMESLKGGMTQDELEALAKDLFPPLGYWDPLNLAKADFWNQGNEATIGFLRHGEIKHGRVALGEALPRLAKTQIILVLGGFEYYGEAGLTENPKHKHYMKGGKPGVYPSFLEEPFPAPHPVPFALFDPFELQKGKSDEWKAGRLKS